MICPDFDQVFYPILNAVRISPDFDQLSMWGVRKQNAVRIYDTCFHMEKIL